MAEGPSTLRNVDLKPFLEVSRRIIAEGVVETGRGLALLVNDFHDHRSEIDTRTLAMAVSALAELGDHRAARALASFLLAVQNPSGAWAPSYQTNGAELSPVADEDVTALVILALLRYVRSSADEAFAEQARTHIEQATVYTRAQTLNPHLYLIETNVSVHGPGLSAGYELWTNCVHAAAFALCHRVFGGERYRRLALLIRRSIGLLMTAEGRFLRRLDASGYPDPRPDVCLISPAYFGLWPASDRIVINSAELIERVLWNVEMGGYLRFLPYSAAERAAPIGPSPCATAWMAQYHYELGNKDRAEAIMRWLLDNAVEGQLAEVLVPSVPALRYLPEQRRALDDSAGSASCTDRRARRRADLDTVEQAAAQQSVVPLGAPMIWAHLEMLRALRKGGYLEGWRSDAASAPLEDEDPVREEG